MIFKKKDTNGLKRVPYIIDPNVLYALMEESKIHNKKLGILLNKLNDEIDLENKYPLFYKELVDLIGDFSRKVEKTPNKEKDPFKSFIMKLVDLMEESSKKV